MSEINIQVSKNNQLLLQFWCQCMEILVWYVMAE